jgi:hypothetical protein
MILAHIWEKERGDLDIHLDQSNPSMNLHMVLCCVTYGDSNKGSHEMYCVVLCCFLTLRKHQHLY